VAVAGFWDICVIPKNAGETDKGTKVFCRAENYQFAKFLKNVAAIRTFSIQEICRAGKNWS
jgi:hypothetical protein